MEKNDDDIIIEETKKFDFLNIILYNAIFKAQKKNYNKLNIFKIKILILKKHQQYRKKKWAAKEERQKNLRLKNRNL